MLCVRCFQAAGCRPSWCPVGRSHRLSMSHKPFKSTSRSTYHSVGCFLLNPTSRARFPSREQCRRRPLHVDTTLKSYDKLQKKPIAKQQSLASPRALLACSLVMDAHTSARGCHGCFSPRALCPASNHKTLAVYQGARSA